MSDKNMLEAGSFETKVQNISEYLKSNVLEPAEKKREEIVENANKEKKTILNNAKKEAEEIINNAKKEAERVKNSLESSLRISAKQGIASLKLALEKEILKKSIKEPLNKVLTSEEMMKSFISELVSLYLTKGINSDFEISLPETMGEKLKNYIQKDVVQKTKKGITLSDESVAKGFQIIFKNGNLMFDFSEESLIDLLSEYLKPTLRNYLFDK